MKLKILHVALVAFSFMFFTACEDKCYYYEDETVFTPVYEKLSDVKASFAVVDDYTITKPGNIYTYGKYLLVGEKMKGIHILDNTNPASPVPLKFINLKGNENFTVYNDVILADNGPDLLSISFADLNDIKILNREVNVNAERVSGDQFIVGYNSSVKRVKKECNSGNNRFSRMDMASSASGTAASTGKGGSMAKFAIISDYLYIANSSQLFPFNIANPSKPVKQLTMGLNGGNVETIFPYNTYLYMGTSSGVLIYNTASSKATPSYINTLWHITGCDPVIVSEDFAFSTVRGGSVCRSNDMSQLNVYDVKNPALATMVRNMNMIEPYGLGIKEDLLFVCQGVNGLFVYDWDKANNSLTLRHSYPDIHAFDVIVNGATLIVTADNGLFQFDISSKDNITYLSKLADF